MTVVNPFVQRRERAAAKASGKWTKQGCYARQFLYDEVNGAFYLKTIPDLMIKESEFNSRYFLWTTAEEDRDTDDPAAVIKSLKFNRVSGRVFEPDNPADFVFVGGRRYVNARETYYDASGRRWQQRRIKAAA